MDTKQFYRIKELYENSSDKNTVRAIVDILDGNADILDLKTDNDIKTYKVAVYVSGVVTLEVVADNKDSAYEEAKKLISKTPTMSVYQPQVVCLDVIV